VAKRKTPRRPPRPKSARRRKTRETDLPPVTQEAVQRLEKLADELESASQEAEEVAKLVREELVDEMTKHLVNGEAKNKEAKKDEKKE
jgi:hypothetical protein